MSRRAFSCFIMFFSFFLLNPGVLPAQSLKDSLKSLKDDLKGLKSNLKDFKRDLKKNLKGETGSDSQTIEASGSEILNVTRDLVESAIKENEQGTPATEEKVIHFNDAGKKFVHESQGESIFLNGANCELEVHGDCPKIHVNGSNNAVSLESVENIFCSGVSNKITFKKGITKELPSISNSGIQNSIEPAR